MQPKHAITAAALILMLGASAAAAEPDLVFRSPAGFSELTDRNSPLFRESAGGAVSGGELLRIYLPEYIAHQYKYGSFDAVTRQVVISGLKGQTRPLDQRDIEVLSRSTESMFNNFASITRHRTDTPAQELERRRKTLEDSMAHGTPLLVEDIRTSTAYIYVWLYHYPMTDNSVKNWLTTAMATAIVPVKGTAVFVSASSILNGRPGPEADLEWVKDAASAFAASIAKNNR